ncbi:hypothetical protein PRZ48_002818 [Zasmidium cellare]|uniref:Uncharacterized protein n=1 Tax=Zasmidium cellare TaxID=395010 RepID=A0ABR0EUS5_ZASCE|nr:hypothetical protein PRZ48_002818 [Zasmidium cellare]
MAPTRKPTAEPSRRSERVKLADAIKVSEQEAKVKAGLIKKKRFRRPRQRAGCRLLKLPGEIRNRIYRFALVESGNLDINPNGPGEPALLRVCRTVRNEGRSIYYTENVFTLKITEFNGAKYMPFMWQFDRYEPLVTKPNVMFDIRGRANWANLVEWVKADHRGPGIRPNLDELAAESDYVMSGAFSLAKTMHWLPWPMLEEALNAMHRALAFTPWGEKWRLFA